MDEKKRRYQVTIMSAVDELQRAFRGLNKLYYNGELEDVIISIQTDPRRQAYAWISVGKVWNDKTENWYREINIVAEWLNRSPEEVIASLLHEMAHLYNMQKGIKDCSRGGSYHNEKFKETAKAHGLNISFHKSYGWTITTPNVETITWVKENVRAGCFRFNRIMTWADGTPKKPKGSGEDESGRPTVVKKGGSNIIKYICPKCGMIVRASRNLDGKIKCVDCDEILIRG